ncbi:MAG: hypothetical protein ACR2OZ_01700 [Verrucomicrobiales bacterium]
MGKASQPAAGKTPPRRSRWRRWLITLGACALLFTFALVIVAALLWQRRTQALNHVLATTLSPWRVEAGAVDVDFRGGTVELRDLRFRESPQDKAWAQARRLRMAATWPGLRERRIDSVELEGLRLHVTENVITQLEKWTSTPDGDAAGQRPGQIGQATLRDARITIDLPNLPAIDTAFDYSGHGLNFETLNFSRQHFGLKHFEATAKDGGALEMEAGTFDFSLAGTDQRLVVHEVTAPKLNAHITPGLMAAIAAPPDKPDQTPNQNDAGAILRSLIVEKLEIGALKFRFSGYVDLPEISFRGQWSGGSAEWNGELAAGLQHARVSELLVIDPAQPAIPLLSIPSLEAGFTASPQTGVTIENASIEHASLLVRPVVLDWLARAKPAPASPGTNPPVTANPQVYVKNLVLTDAAISILSLTNSPHLPLALPDAQWKVDAAVKELKIHPGGKIESADMQRLVLREAQAAFDPGDPLVQFPTAEIEIVPDDFFARRELKLLRWLEPEVHLSPSQFAAFQKRVLPVTANANTSRANSIGPDRAETSEPAACPQGPAGTKSFWHGLRARNLEVVHGRLKLAEFGRSFPNIDTKVGIQTDGSSGHYHVELSDLQAAAPAIPDLPFGRLPSVVGEVDPLRVWERQLESVTIEGGSIDIGEAMRSLKSAEPADGTAEENREAPASPAGQPWQIGQASVAETGVTVSNIVPLLDPVTFQLSFSATQLPLSRAGLLLQNDPQRIELTGIRLNSSSPTGPLPVASFETVFVGFSMAGLLEQRIDHIELISPVVYVGEQLFWYVDYFRKTTGGEKRPPQTAPASGADEPGWSVSRIDAHFGRMVLALKGDVLDAMPPLPFSCSTQLDEGRAELVLEIPRGTYRPSTRVPIELDVEEGSAVFNLPLKQESNNLVQMFRVSELRYGRGKPFRAQNAYASVTYDKSGVYAKFGGKLYGGYASGAFNLYLDDNLSWDGWLFGEKIQTKPLTDIMTPEYFRMSGACGFKLLAYGDMESLYTATGTISTVTAGEMTITGLDSLKKQLPSDWSALQRSLTENGIDTLQNFPYETCRGDFQIFGREANLKLDVKGPAGTRFFDLRVHNHSVPAPRLSKNE